MAAAMSERFKRFNFYKFLLSIPGILLVYSVLFLIYFLLRNSPDGNNPIFLKLGGLTFRWYGIIITLGVIFAAFTTQYLAERRGENPDRTWVILPVVLVGGIIGARFWYVFNTWSKYQNHIFTFNDPNNAGAFEVWRGGIAIQGAVVGGLICLFIYKLLAGLNFLRWADFIAPGLIAAQACGRWGNFMNNEAYGNPTKLPWGVKIPCEYRTSGNTPGTVDTSCPRTPSDQLFHPTFLYESVWDYAVFITLLFAITRPKTVHRWTKLRLRDGDIFFLYLIFYSIGRFVVESLRTDSLYIIGDPVSGGVRSAQALAVASIFLGAIALFYRHRRPFPETQSLSVRVRPEPSRKQLRQQQLNLAHSSAGTGAAGSTSLFTENKVEESEINTDREELSEVNSSSQNKQLLDESVVEEGQETPIAPANGVEEADSLAAEAAQDEDNGLSRDKEKDAVWRQGRGSSDQVVVEQQSNPKPKG